MNELSPPEIIRKALIPKGGQIPLLFFFPYRLPSVKFKLKDKPRKQKQNKTKTTTTKSNQKRSTKTKTKPLPLQHDLFISGSVCQLKSYQPDPNLSYSLNLWSSLKQPFPRL